MPWNCPHCGTPIQHNVREARPRFGVRYRCHECRRELAMDPATVKLVEVDAAMLTKQMPSSQT